MDVLRVGAALVLLGWLPGYAWTRALMPRLTRVERFTYSVGLSVALLVLVLFLGDVLLHIPITWWSSVGASLLLTGAALLPKAWTRWRRG